MPENSEAAPVLSLIVPVYNESSRIVSTLPQMFAYLEARPESFEIIVVDDGSSDDTESHVEVLASTGRGLNNRRDGNVLRVLQHRANRGKGAAVRTGMLAARGEYLIFTDADLSTPMTEVRPFLDLLRSGVDVVIGSRALRRELIATHQSAFREFSGKLFNRALRLITGLDYWDTQCGFKGLRRDAARRIFALQTIERFGFDAEILYLAKKFGYSAREVPVHWAHSEGTKVRILRDGVRSFLDLILIRWNDVRGKYRASGSS